MTSKTLNQARQTAKDGSYCNKNGMMMMVRRPTTTQQEKREGRKERDVYALLFHAACLWYITDSFFLY